MSESAPYSCRESDALAPHSKRLVVQQRQRRRRVGRRAVLPPLRLRRPLRRRHAARPARRLAADALAVVALAVVGRSVDAGHRRPQSTGPSSSTSSSAGQLQLGLFPDYLDRLDPDTIDSLSVPSGLHWAKRSVRVNLFLNVTFLDFPTIFRSNQPIERQRRRIHHSRRRSDDVARGRGRATGDAS